MTDNRLVFLDTETTGLDARIHDVIEAAWALDDEPVESTLFAHTLEYADIKALEVNRYYERDLFRFAGPPAKPARSPQLVKALTGNTIVAENYGFDVGMLLSKLGFEPWHYRKIELSSVALTVFDLDRPESMKDTAARLRRLGYWIPEPDHSARADVECLRACYRTLRGGSVREAMRGDQRARDIITDNFNDNYLAQFRADLGRPARKVVQQPLGEYVPNAQDTAL